MDDEDDGPPMLVSGDVVDDVDASLNAEMADAQIKKVPISIITGELISYFACRISGTTTTSLRCSLYPAPRIRLTTELVVSTATA
jgi:hypothetical protein